MNTPTFGEAPAPYLATSCLQQLAREHKLELPDGAKALNTDTDVDILATSFNKIILFDKPLIFETNYARSLIVENFTFVDGLLIVQKC